MCLLDKFVPDCEGFNVRGIKEVGFLPFNNKIKIEKVGSKYVVTTSTPFVRFYFYTPTGFFEEKAVFTTNDKFLEITLSLNFNNFSFDNKEALTPFLDLQVLAYVVDNKDRKWILGVEDGLRCISYLSQTGSLRNNYNGFNLIWNGRGLGEVEIIENPTCTGFVLNGECIAPNELPIVANRYGLSLGSATGGLVDTEIETNPADFNYISAFASKNGVITPIPFPISDDTVQSEFIYDMFGTEYKVTDYFLGNANADYLRIGLLPNATLDRVNRVININFNVRYFTPVTSPTYKMYITKPDTTIETFNLLTSTPPDGSSHVFTYKYSQLGIHRATIEVINNNKISSLQTFYFIVF
jgi:hypothetical protein